MPTSLPPKRGRESKAFAVDSALLVAVLLLCATLQIATQLYFATPLYPFNITHVMLQVAER